MGIKFAEVWKRRHEIQPILIENLIDERAKGRNQSLVFLIRIRDEEVIGKIFEIQSRLSSISCIDLIPKDYFSHNGESLWLLGRIKEV